MSMQGPLPKVDAGIVLQEESKRALQAMFPPSEFIFRDERTDDFGVDCSLELIINGEATNIRSQIQLKGRSRTVPNNDGSVAVSISTANLTYLLNGNCPLYVLYRPETKELRFALAREVWTQLEHENADWRAQQSITVHFKRVLTQDSVEDIKKIIGAEAQLRRAVGDQLSMLRNAAGHAVHIDADTLQVTDSQQLVEALSRAGHALTNSGLARVVIKQARLVPAALLYKDAQAALSVAYAHFHLSNYHDASAVIRQILLTKPQLEPESSALLDLLFVCVRRMLSEFDETQYEAALEAWSQSAPRDLATQLEISRAWSAYVKTIRGTAISLKSKSQARESVEHALDQARRINNQYTRDYVELLTLTLAHHDLSDATIDANAIQGISMRGYGDAHFAREKARAAAQAMAGWFQAVDSLAARTRETAPHTYCGVLMLRNHAVLEMVRQRRYAAWTRGESEPVDSPVLTAAAEEPLRVARILEDRDLELSALLDLARTHDVCGRDEEATATAKEALRIAELLSSEVHTRQAQEFLAGGERMDARLREITNVSERSEEELIRGASDDQLLFMATTMATSYRVPASRIPNILYSLSCQRQLDEAPYGAAAWTSDA